VSPLEALKYYWGHESFRSLQPEIIESVLNGNDTLALLPTGGGKSICFQVPALINPGICLVISPLIALMKDQVENLRSRNIPAAAIFSGMKKEEIETIMNNAVNGAYKFLYLSPERLQTEYTQEKIAVMKVNLLAIDEAHCISQWGYDFRPEYLKIAEIRSLFANVPVLALTATATSNVVTDIQEKMLFKKPNVFRKSFERKNLSYIVRNTEDKDNKMLEICNKLPGTGIIYAANRRQTQQISELLKKNNISSAFYHAGLSSKERNDIQEGWIKNKIRVIVCTNAFGMGIDKPDVRFVIHYQMASSLEAYYQEAGRAGRDGLRSFCVVLHEEHDEISANQLLQQKYTDKETQVLIYEQVCNYLGIGIGSGADESFRFDLKSFCTEYKWNAFIVNSALNQLEKNGLLKANNALFNPSKVHILVHRDELTGYMEKNPAHDPIIRNLVRSYGGIFDFLTQVNEKDIAARTPGKSSSDIINCLSRLHELKYIFYDQQHDEAQIVLLSDRLPSSYIIINEAEQDQLKKTELEKLNKSMYYAHQDKLCRSRILLSYFDEIKEEPCGVCDICISNRKKEMSNSQFKAIYDAIEYELKKNPLSLPLLYKALPAIKKQELTEAVNYLLSQEILEYNNRNELVLV
jgi:ATP-dependent DNA helicase RecQ